MLYFNVPEKLANNRPKAEKQKELTMWKMPLGFMLFVTALIATVAFSTRVVKVDAAKDYVQVKQMEEDLKATKWGDLVVFKKDNTIGMVMEDWHGQNIAIARRVDEGNIKKTIESMAYHYQNYRIIRKGESGYDNALKEFYNSSR